MDEVESSQILYDWFGYAAKHGDLETIQSMLTGENPVPVDCICCNLRDAANVYYEYVTPLFLACQEGHLAIVQELIRAGADVNWKHVVYKNPPHDEAFPNGGNPAWVESIFKWDAPVNATVVTVCTPLHAACSVTDSPEIVEALLAAGADVNATVYMTRGIEYTPLMSLARYGQLEIANLLLAAGCHVNQETQDGHTALVCACQSGYDNHEFIRWLFEHGARVTPDAWFAGIGTDPVRVRLLLDHHADVSIKNEDGRTALMEAVSLNGPDDKISVVRMLLERMNTVDEKLIDLRDKMDDTALHLAARYCSWQVINELLNWGPNLFLQSRHPALHQAIHAIGESNIINNIRCFVEHANGYGLNRINIQNSFGLTVLHVALEKASTNKFVNYLPVIEYLSTKVDVSIQDMKGNTPLHIAVKCGDSSETMVQMLLRSPRATKAVNTKNDLGITPLQEAVLRNSANLVQAIGRIADVNIPCHAGKTALHYAVTAKATSCVDHLLMLNANAAVRDNDDNTALMLACNSCYDDGEIHSQLTIIFQLYKHGVAYGEVLNMMG